MRKTIGTVNAQHSLLIHNAKGFPLGMAIVSFTRASDALRARERYNGKVIDGSTCSFHPLLFFLVSQGIISTCKLTTLVFLTIRSWSRFFLVTVYNPSRTHVKTRARN